MSTKTYVLQAASRQWPTKKAGDTVDLPPAAAKYLVQAGVLAEPSIEPAAETGKRRKAEG